jgi:ATP-dependent helicase/nuclease subunit B
LADAVDRFFCTELQDELAGATEEAISGRCRWLATQLGAKVEKHPALGAVIAWSSELNELVAGRKVVGRVELERMVQDIMGMGGAAPAAVCQVAPWQVLGHPGQLLESVDVVLWCGFDDNRGGSQAAWSRVELDWLARHGVLLDSPMAARAREASAWRRALLGARQGFVAFTSRRKAGEDCFQHPLWDEVFGLAASLPGSPSEGKVKAKLTRRSEQLLDSQGAWNLSGRSTQLEAHTLGDGTPSSSLPAVVKVPTGSITIKEKLSYSSAEMLLKCPLRWVLSRHAFLKGPGDLALPSGNGMLGTFFHFLAEQVFLGKDKKPCNAGPIAAQDHAGDLFDRHVGAMASELLLPENAGIRIATRSAMVGAMGWLAGYLESEKLAVESLEAPLFSPWHQGISLGGRVDMLLKDGSGGHTVLDHKWVRTSVYLEGDIKAKRALQLAIYTWAAGCELGPSCKAAYHLVKQQRCLIPEPNGLRETWEAADKALRANVDELLRGRVNIRQPSPDEGEVPAEAQQLLADLVFFRPKKGRCTYCSFTAICSEHQEGDK